MLTFVFYIQLATYKVLIITNNERNDILRDNKAVNKKNKSEIGKIYASSIYATQSFQI